jgi:hypothetical protein
MLLGCDMMWKKTVPALFVGLMLVSTTTSHAIDGEITFGSKKGQKVERWEDLLVKELTNQNEVLEKISGQLDKNNKVLEGIASSIKEFSSASSKFKAPNTKALASVNDSNAIGNQLAEIKKNQEALMLALQGSIEQQKWQQKLLDSMVQGVQPPSSPNAPTEIPIQEGEPVQLKF